MGVLHPCHPYHTWSFFLILVILREAEDLLFAFAFAVALQPDKHSV